MVDGARAAIALGTTWAMRSPRIVRTLTGMTTTWIATTYENNRAMIELPDPIERGEVACEDWYFDSKVGDQHRCGCGRLFNLEDGNGVSADPYAIPVCPVCFKEWCEENE